MDRRVDILKTLKIGRHDSGQLLFETRQFRAVCRQAGAQGVQFSSDLRQHPLELGDDLHGSAMRAQLSVPTVIDRSAAEPAVLANQTRRPDHIVTITDDTGVHGKPGKLAERHDILIRRDGEHSSPQPFPRFPPVGYDPVLSIISQRDLEVIARTASDLRRVARYPLGFSFELGDGGLHPPFALLKECLMLGGNSDPARLVAQIRQIPAGIEKGELIKDLADRGCLAPLHRTTPPRADACSCCSC
jgi:hypothetical protein